MEAAKEISLDGRILRGVENTGGEVGGETKFVFQQAGEILTGSYSGGEVLKGHLVGTVAENVWDIRYVQINQNGETATGHSIGEITLTEDGRVRVKDDWKWESKPGGGHSILEEVSSYQNVEKS